MNMKQKRRRRRVEICLLGHQRGNSIHDVVPFIADKVNPE
jgi:hypothetical protein